MSNRKVTKDVSDPIIASAILASFPLNKADRILEGHASDRATVVVKGSNLIPLRITDSWFLIDTDTDVSTADIDTGAIEAGKDYCVYACDDAGTLIFLVSLATTFPAGFDANTSRKIGGFHTLCASVGVISGHPLTGYLAGEILPASIWDLKHRPKAEPAGMVYSESAGIWVDIYLASGTGANTASVNGGTISDGRNWMDFVDDFAAVKKQLLDDPEFQVIAAGSPEEVNIQGSADPVTTGAHVATNARRIISGIGCEDCCGVMWQWLRDQSFRCDPDGSVQAASKTLSAYHAAAPGGNPIYCKYDASGFPYLCCNMATDAADKILTFGAAYTVLIKHDPDAATGGYQVYFDEDATQPARLLCALPGLKTDYVRTSNPNYLLQITYHAAPATPGVAIHFDDGADERLEFGSPTAANGTLDLALNSQNFGWYDLPGAKGSLYRQGTYGDVKLLAGAAWSHGADSGSRARDAYRYRWYASSNIGSRGQSEPR